MRTLSLLAFATSATVISAIKVTFTNKCEHPISLYNNFATVPIKAGDVHTRVCEMQGGTESINMFRHTSDPQATLAEITVNKDAVWFDISIIPTSPKQGPEHCIGLDACKKFTGGVGYNVPMQIAPRSGHGGACRTLTCLYDGCPDAYLYPDDNLKTHSCPAGTDMDVTFCPGGKGGETTAPPTPPPTTTPVPTTPAPTTTPPPTTLPVPSETIANQTRPGATEEKILSPIITEAPTTIAAPAGNVEMPVEANVQTSSTQDSNSLDTLLMVGGAVAVAAGVVVVVMIRRKKAALDELDDKSPSSIVRHSAFSTL